MAAKIEKTKIKCMKCKTERTSSTATYYANNNPLFSTEKFEVCKVCVLNYIGDKDSRGQINRIYLVLAMLDKPFLIDMWEDCGREWSKYITQISSLNQNKGLSFKDSNFVLKVYNTEDNFSGDINPDNDAKFYSSKWMGDYTKSDIEYLENYYIGLDRDFKIVTTNHKDYARKIAKASLHMDKCFQDLLNGTAGADAKYKAARETFDTLSKSAQFSESQRGQNDVSLGCFGRVFDMVEAKTFIPEHIVTNPDDIDKMIEDFKHIFKSI